MYDLHMENFFTTARGLRAAWDTVKRPIEFKVVFKAERLAYPSGSVANQPIRNRVRHTCRRFDLFLPEA